MQHMQLFQEDCPYERDLRVSRTPYIQSVMAIPVTCNGQFDLCQLFE